MSALLVLSELHRWLKSLAQSIFHDRKALQAAIIPKYWVRRASDRTTFWELSSRSVTNAYVRLCSLNYSRRDRMVATCVDCPRIQRKFVILNDWLTQISFHGILVVVIVDIFVLSIDLVGSLDHPFHKCLHSIFVVLRHLVPFGCYWEIIRKGWKDLYLHFALSAMLGSTFGPLILSSTLLSKFFCSLSLST